MKYTNTYVISSHFVTIINEHKYDHVLKKKNFQEEQHLRQLSGLQKRLEELENNQQQQLQELTPPLDRDRERDRVLAPQDSLSDLWPFTIRLFVTRPILVLKS